MQGRLDYRGLRRWSMLLLFPVLIVSAWVAAMLMVLVTLPVTLPAFSAAAIAGVGIFGIAALIVPPVIGTIAGLLGMLRAKSQMVRAFNASPLPRNHPLVGVTSQMAARLGMPAPEVYVYPDEDINAWATGTSASNAAVGLSRGAFDRLSRDHIHAVVAHELGHIAAADLRRMAFATGFQNALVWFFGFKSWRWNAQHIFGFVGQMGIMGMSRRREYWADAVGAILTSPETMRDALRAVERDATRPARKRRYFNQLMFNWPGSPLLASHPTFAQRYATLNEGAFHAMALRKMGAASSFGLGNGEDHSWQERFNVWWRVNRANAAMAATVVAIMSAPGLMMYEWQMRASEDSEPHWPVVYNQEAVPVVAGSRVAAWSHIEEPAVVPPPPRDELADEPVGYRCFKLLDRRLPVGVSQAFDESKEWLQYSASSVTAEPSLQQIPASLRDCLRKSGAKLEPKASAVENRKIEVWAYANETTCWFTPAAARAGSGPFTVLGRCHSPED